MASVQSLPAYLHPGVSVSQPPHLEGDPSLATEILPGPPPLDSLQQVGLPRKDHKKTTVAFSYLPASDPGTTYSSHFASAIPAASTDMDGTRRKRARLDKGGERNRSQRASARNLAAGGPLSDPIAGPEVAASSSQLAPDYDPLSIPLDSDDVMVSRATTAHAEGSPPESVLPVKRVRGRMGKDSGKGKERERDAVVKVKEEPTVVSLGNDAVASLSNEDHCSACRSFGSLVYCDGCPRAFHLWCLDPPMEPADLPEGERWFCPACLLEQRPPPKPPASLKFMAPLIHELSTRIPSEYQLPHDIRTFFKDVSSSARGTYLDTSEIKQARLNRHGQLEDRDPYRLKDRNGEPVLCFRCGTSALPPGLAADSPTVKRARRTTSSSGVNYDTGRAIISCDYCHLHWHLDCLDPPLVFMPPWNKKWMCPNHAERVLQPKHRIPRAHATPIDITKPRQWNNGIIEIVNTDAAPPPAVVPQRLNVDEVLINGRRYRVPERIITLDFWDKVSKGGGGIGEAYRSREVDASSRMSSPLTSLSSLDGEDRLPPMSLEPSLYTLDDVKFAQLLCGLRLQNASTASEGPSGSNSGSSQGDTSGTNNTVPPLRVKEENGVAHDIPDQVSQTSTDEGVQGDTAGSSSRPRRAAASRTPAPARSRSTRRSGRWADGEVPMDVDLPELVISSGKRPDARRKAARPPQTSESTSSASALVASAVEATPEVDKPSEVASTSSASASVRPKRNRQHPRPQPARATVSSGTDAVATSSHDPSHAEVKPGPSTRTARTTAGSSQTGRKKGNSTVEGPANTSRGHHKPVTPPNANGHAAPASAPEQKSEATPTLKIRLPRLGAFTSPSVVAQATTSEATPKASPTKVTAASSSSSRSRRSLRRQASLSTSFNSATTSEASASSRVNETGLSTSPIESF
ncbi:hypothetical protein BV20DRAFT_941308 [Pilatotrama ljubarskyi]|nr:hypothetical protein BV20DRAFT_941308 [Pilatotrama ljubarskyi]